MKNVKFYDEEICLRRFFLEMVRLWGNVVLDIEKVSKWKNREFLNLGKNEKLFKKWDLVLVYYLV